MVISKYTWINPAVICVNKKRYHSVFNSVPQKLLRLLEKVEKQVETNFIDQIRMPLHEKEDFYG